VKDVAAVSVKKCDLTRIEVSLVLSINNNCNHECYGIDKVLLQVQGRNGANV